MDRWYKDYTCHNKQRGQVINSQLLSTLVPIALTTSTISYWA